MTRSDASWNDVTTLPDGRVAWVYLRGTAVVCEDAETGAVLWSIHAERQLLYLRAAADGQGRVCAVGVGQDDRAAAVMDGRLPIDLGPAHGNFAVEIFGLLTGWHVAVQRSPTTYDIMRVTEAGDAFSIATRTMPATSQGFLDVRDGVLVTSDVGRHAHGLVLPNVAGGVWAGQLPDPNGLALYDETTDQRSTLFHGDSQPPHIAQDARGAFYVCAWRTHGAWVERYTRPFTPDPEDDEMNTPGVTIDHFDPVIRPGEPWRIAFHDRNNPDACVCAVEILDGSVHVRIANREGTDRSGQRRPVEVRCDG